MGKGSRHHKDIKIGKIVPPYHKKIQSKLETCCNRESFRCCLGFDVVDSSCLSCLKTNCNEQTMVIAYKRRELRFKLIPNSNDTFKAPEIKLDTFDPLSSLAKTDPTMPARIIRPYVCEQILLCI